LQDSEAWHGRSLEVGLLFLPEKCPLVSHVKTSYFKHYSMSVFEPSTPVPAKKILKASLKKSVSNSSLKMTVHGQQDSITLQKL
jgi:hypothetical protein